MSSSALSSSGDSSGGLVPVADADADADADRDEDADEVAVV